MYIPRIRENKDREARRPTSTKPRSNMRAAGSLGEYPEQMQNRWAAGMGPMASFARISIRGTTASAPHI